MATTRIERFFLYGEAPRPVEDRFVHLEFLDDRSRPANWIIRPHAHADLHQIFIVDEGGGRVDADGRQVDFAAPSIVVVPAGVVHGFAWRENSVGRVLTFAVAIVAGIAQREPGIPALFADGLWTAPVDSSAWPDLLDALAPELAWAAPGHGLAIEAYLSAALVQALRARNDADLTASSAADAQALLVARFRDCVEACFRRQPSIKEIARVLGVSPSTLRAACQERAGGSPTSILHNRIVLEAKRLMRYSNMSIGQIAVYLGFSDAAYFSRFFSREAGMSPRAFKQSEGRAPASKARRSRARSEAKLRTR